MKQNHASRTSRGSSRIHELSASPRGSTPVESELAALREANALLQQRLTEAELRAEMRVRAFRILAIPDHE